jgi:hypothetical protein
LDRSYRADRAALVLIVVIPALLYVFGLGIYIDGWGFLWSMHSSADQSWTGLYRTLAEQPALAVRPLQIAWLVASYKLSPGAILPVHLANQGLFAISELLLHAALYRNAGLRPFAFPLVASYLCLPTFITARFWWANHQSGISLLFFAVALFLTQRWLSGDRRYASLAGAALATAATLLAYAMPGFVLPIAPALLALAEGAQPRELPHDRKVVAATLAIGGGLVAASLFKLGVGYGAEVPAAGDEFAREAAWLYARAGFTSFWTHGIAEPVFAARIASGPYGSLLGPLAGAATALLLTWRLRARQWLPPARLDRAARFAAAGVLVFVLGYVPFLANFWFGGSPFGTANRVHIAGAMGVALVLVAIGTAIAAKSPRAAGVLFVLYCASGVSTQVVIGRNWGDAWTLQQRIAAELARRAMPIPEGGTLLLYGHCPYFGAVPVFPPDAWLGRSLALRTGAPPFRGNTIVAGTRPAATGVEVRDANHLGAVAPGGIYSYRGLVVYDLRDHLRYPIADRAAAEAFFAAHPPDRSTGCSYRGQAGLPLF